MARVLAEEGDRVEAGQPVFQLVSPPATEERRAWRPSASAWRSEASRSREEGRARPGLRVREPGRFRRCGLEERHGARGAALVRSPVAGRVLTPYLRGPAGTVLSGRDASGRSGRRPQLAAELLSRSGSSTTSRRTHRSRPSSADTRGRFGDGSSRSSPAALAQPATLRGPVDPRGGRGPARKVRRTGGLRQRGRAA